MASIKTIQIILGVKPDDVWGPKSQQALNAALDDPAKIKGIQTELGVVADGQWGTKSQASLNSLIGSIVHGGYKASSFADPADVRAFNRCKAQGGTDLHCFAVGDNGIGQFGKITAQEDIPMVAVNREEMISKWGSEHGSAHRPVEVTINGKVFQATVEDRISAPGRIDLNPACAKLAGLQPPFVVPCTWKWI